MINKLINVNDHLENIVRNSGEHCHFCKIMNVTQLPFQKKKFQDERYDIDNLSLNLVPESIIKLGEIKLCHECFSDSGYDKLNVEKNVKLCGGYSDLEIETLEQNRGL